jgi:hypothetical protein
MGKPKPSPGPTDRVHGASVTWVISGVRDGLLHDFRRHPRCAGPPGLASLLLEVFAGPVPLMAGAAAAGDPMAVLPALFHLMWRHALAVDLTARLTAETPVVAGAAPGGAR